MENMPLIDCQNLNFSPRLSENRTDQAQQTLGSIVVQRILCFALYLLGLNRRAIGRSRQVAVDVNGGHGIPIARLTEVAVTRASPRRHRERS